MSIKKYFAIADNTITNAFEENLSTRGTGSNMGQSDILEVFSIYAQQSTGSSELARSLIQFNIPSIASDRTAGTIPASGSVSFYLKLYNAEHSLTLPRNYHLEVNSISVNWEEGNGLDMDNYTDLTYDFTGSNWINAQGSPSAATLVDAIDVAGVAQNDKFTMTVPASAGGDGVTYTFLFDSGTDVEANEEENTFGISLTSVTDEADTAAVLIKAINGTADNKYKYGAANLGAGSALTAGTIGLTAKAGSSNTKVTLTMDTSGSAGNVASVLAAETNFGSDKVLEAAFTGGRGPWSTQGGDYHTDTSSSFKQHFEIGDENLEIDVTTLVEQWLNSGGNVLGSKTNYGVLVRLSGSQEATSSLSPAGGGATKSYYTKKFFGRGTEFFFEKPSIEARWDSSRRDNRGTFYFSSSIAPASENLNTLFLYNYVRGRLRDIGGTQSPNQLPVLNLYYASGSVPEASAQYFRNSSNEAVNFLSSSRVSEGVYKVQFSVTSSVVTSVYPYLVDVWTYSGSQIQTGSAFTPTDFGMENYDVSNTHVLTMPKLLKKYSNKETERFRLFVRDKGWSPNVYTKAVSTIDSKIIESASFQIMRTVDQKVVIPYGTGSDNYSMLSYDVSGNYFDFDMSLLESGYTYAFKYSFYDDAVGGYREQPYLFKFKVENDEY